MGEEQAPHSLSGLLFLTPYGQLAVLQSDTGQSSVRIAADVDRRQGLSLIHI